MQTGLVAIVSALLVFGITLNRIPSAVLPWYFKAVRFSDRIVWLKGSNEEFLKSLEKTSTNDEGNGRREGQGKPPRGRRL